MKMQILQFLTYLALPLTLIGVVDDWFLRPARRLAALPAESHDPAWLRVVYTVLPVAVIGAIVRLLVSERLDFSLVLTLVLSISGLIWAVDRWLLAPQRQRRALAAGVDASAVALPVTVDYARSFLPVAALVLVVRAFIFEPFRIPSDSMMPTLLDGDFIVVNKFAYGLRMPVLNRKLMAIGEPERGDVVVFRYPPDPAVNYIKRLVGLPGDHRLDPGRPADRQWHAGAGDRSRPFQRWLLPQHATGRGAVGQAPAPDALLPHQRRAGRTAGGQLQPQHGPQLSM